MKVREVTELRSFFVVIEDHGGYIRYCEGNWYKCSSNKDKYIKDKELIKKLEKAYQEYLK